MLWGSDHCRAPPVIFARNASTETIPVVWRQVFEKLHVIGVLTLCSSASLLKQACRTMSRLKNEETNRSSARRLVERIMIARKELPVKDKIPQRLPHL